MSNQSGKSSEGKVGSDPKAAEQFGGKDDFGAKESDPIARGYASRGVKEQDPGAPPAHSDGSGVRVTGVGSNESGPGSGSGGDLDTDIIGVGTGGSGVATSGEIHEPPGPDDAQQKPSRDPNRIKMHGVSNAVKGTTIDRSGGDVSTTGAGQGAAAITNPNIPDNNGSVGELSNDEAAGMDNSPSDRK